MAAPMTHAPALTFKRRNWLYVPAGGFVDYKNPTVTELIAASVMDFTRLAFRDGTDQPSQSTERVQANQLLGDDLNYERKGVTSVTGSTLTWRTDPQAADASDGAKLWELFAAGPDGGFLVRRLNVARDTAIAATQKVSIFPADLSPALEIEVGQGSAGEVGGVSEYFIRDEIAQRVEVQPAA